MHPAARGQFWGAAGDALTFGCGEDRYRTQVNEQASMERPKTSREIGQELEDAVEAFLSQSGVAYFRPHRFRSKSFGLWDIDFYVKTSPPVLVSCKNPTKPASVIRKAQEAFLQLYGLAHLCPDVLTEARIVLVTGDLPLKTRGKDYEALISAFLGERFSVVRRSDLGALRPLLGLG
jgi:hypothetical protein